MGWSGSTALPDATRHDLAQVMGWTAHGRPSHHHPVACRSHPAPCGVSVELPIACLGPDHEPSQRPLTSRYNHSVRRVADRVIRPAREPLAQRLPPRHTHAIGRGRSPCRPGNTMRPRRLRRPSFPSFRAQWRMGGVGVYRETQRRQRSVSTPERASTAGRSRAAIPAARTNNRSVLGRGGSAACLPRPTAHVGLGDTTEAVVRPLRRKRCHGNGGLWASDNRFGDSPRPQTDRTAEPGPPPPELHLPW
jgi:hypothetical protein